MGFSRINTAKCVHSAHFVHGVRKFAQGVECGGHLQLSPAERGLHESGYPNRHGYWIKTIQ